MSNQSCSNFKGFGNKPTGAQSRASTQSLKSQDSKPTGDLKFLMDDAAAQAWTYENKPKTNGVYQIDVILRDGQVLNLICPNWKLGWWKRFLTQHRVVIGFTVDRLF